MLFYLGCLNFGLFFLSDYNDARLHHRYLIFSFPLGAVALFLSVIFQLDREAAPVEGRFFQVLIWAFFLLFTSILIYTLFFSFPASSAYAAPGKKRPVCDRGFYALCRHPGVLCAALSLICLWLVGGLPLYAAITYIILDIALVTFEDLYVFPMVLSGYEKYRHSTPFLFPTPKSIRTAFTKTRTGSVSVR